MATEVPISRFQSLSLPKMLFIGLFVLPVALLTLYEYLIATDRFESTASVYITEEQSQNSLLDLSLLGITNSGSARDIHVLKAFIESQDMLDLLDRELELRKHFSDTTADFFSRMARDASKEDSLEYYLDRVQLTFEDDAQLLKFSVQSFDREYSRKILESILKHSQIFIDQLNEEISTSQLDFFTKAVKQSEDDLLAENRALRDFQNKHGILSTEIATKTIVGTIASLEEKLATKQAEMNSRIGELDKRSVAIRRLQSEIDAINIQIKLENDRLASDEITSLSEIDSKFRDINLRIEYKTLRLKANLDAFEKAQIEAARRLRFLTVVSAPTLADESRYPDRPYIVITGSMIALMIYFIVSITIAMVREHA